MARQRRGGWHAYRIVGNGGIKPGNPALTVHPDAAEIAQPQPERLMAKITVFIWSECDQKARHPQRAGLRMAELFKQCIKPRPQALRRLWPVHQQAAQSGDITGQSQLLVQQIIQQLVLLADTVMAPERLNAQHIERQHLRNHALMGGADGVGGLRFPQQTGVLQQTRLHFAQRAEKRHAVGLARHHHHHQATAQNADDHFADARLGDIPELCGFNRIDQRKSDDGGGISGKLKGVGGVVMKIARNPGAEREPQRHCPGE
ncbi:hypothetical protein BN129_967 [Cronobacter sakazakii 701]|nr:hypothetical protein BN129_967 [Cronobacter sakazakii 701]